MLVEKLKAERIYAGGILREMAKHKGMTLQELLTFAETHPEIHTTVDTEIARKAKELDAQGKIIIVEGRVQFHFLPESCKLFIKVSIEEGARRIWKDLQSQKTREERNEGSAVSLEATTKKVAQRIEEDRKRYLQLYKVDLYQESIYDIVVDTTRMTAEQAAEKVVQLLRAQGKLHQKR